MHFKLLALTGWALIVSIAVSDTTIESLFTIKTDTDAKGGCKQRLPSPIDTFVSESKTLVASGLQALSDAQNPSASEHDVAVRYLWTYFHTTTGDKDKFNLVKANLERVKDFLDGQSELENTPHLYCNDKWLEKLERTDALWDADRDLIFTMAHDGVETPIAIEDFKDYADHLWEHPDTRTGSNGRVPYWSDDLKQYLFDEEYNGKTYCTSSKDNLGVTQEQTVIATMTLCPSSFTKKGASATLGKKPAKGVSIEKVIPRSGTFYHELFHLELGNSKTPDLTYSWKEQQELLKTPDEISPDHGGTYDELVRHNPETFLWFSVGYWYFQQTSWSTSANQRWSFHNGAGELVQI